MNSWTVFLTTVYHLLISAMAWIPQNSLILRGKENYVDLKFPASVEYSRELRRVVYYDIDHRVTYEYCPKDGQDKRCNYPELFTTIDFIDKRFPKGICDSVVEYDLAAPFGIVGQYRMCHHDGKQGKQFEFVYRIWKEGINEEDLIKIYEMCYNEDRKQIIVGSYTIHHPNLLRNRYLQEEQNFEFGFETEPAADPSYNQDYFEAVHRLYQENPNYVPRSVLPPELRAYALERKPFYNHMNFAPMHVEVIEGWKKMMNILKKKLSRMGDPMQVTAGLIANKNSRFLGTNDGLQVDIPAHWWVMISTSDVSEGIVIMMPNEFYEGENRPKSDSYFKHCSPDYCHEAKLSDSMATIPSFPDNLIIRCCRPIQIKQRFNLNIGNRILIFPV